MLNKTVQIGRIPDFANSIKTSNLEDEKRAVVSFFLSVQKDYKKKDEKYFEDELFSYKAFGKSAQFIAKHFKPGDNVYVVSRPVASVKKPDSDEYYPMYFNVETISWLPKTSSSSNGNANKAVAPAEEAVSTNSSENDLFSDYM